MLTMSHLPTFFQMSTMPEYLNKVRRIKGTISTTNVQDVKALLLETVTRAIVDTAHLHCFFCRHEFVLHRRHENAVGQVRTYEKAHVKAGT